MDTGTPPPLNARIYHFSRDGSVFAKVDLRKAAAMWSKGELRKGDSYWTDGMAEWSSVSALADLLEQTRIDNAALAVATATSADRRRPWKCLDCGATCAVHAECPSSAREILVAIAFGVLAYIVLFAGIVLGGGLAGASLGSGFTRGSGEMAVMGAILMVIVVLAAVVGFIALLIGVVARVIAAGIIIADRKTRGDRRCPRCNGCRLVKA